MKHSQIAYALLALGMTAAVQGRPAPQTDENMDGIVDDLVRPLPAPFWHSNADPQSTQPEVTVTTVIWSATVVATGVQNENGGVSLDSAGQAAVDSAKAALPEETTQAPAPAPETTTDPAAMPSSEYGYSSSFSSSMCLPPTARGLTSPAAVTAGPTLDQDRLATVLSLLAAAATTAPSTQISGCASQTWQNGYAPSAVPAMCGRS